MPAVSVQVAEAIRAEIEAADFGLDFLLERSYAEWDEELEELDVLRVDVVPHFAAKLEQQDRAASLWSVSVDVGVRKKFGQQHRTSSGRIDVSKIDDLVLLTEQIGEHFCPTGTLAGRLPDVSGAAWESSPGAMPGETGSMQSGTDFRALFNRDHLRRLAQFTSIVRLNYQVTKDP